MLSYTTRRNLYGKLTNDESSANLALGDTLMNEEEKRICNTRAWDFTQRTKTKTTVANQQFYDLPVNYRRLIGNPTVTVGSTIHTPREITSRADWDRLNSSSQTSDIPTHFYIFNRQIGFYPKAASNGNTITLPIEIQFRDLAVADYTTGSIVSIANAATAVTGTGTTWPAGMVGRHIRITEDNTATSGDGEWYEIGSRSSNTSIGLDIPYEGTTISAATQGYTIAQLSMLPDGHHMIPVHYAVALYYAKKEKNLTKVFFELYKDGLQTLVTDRSAKTSNPAFEDETVPLNPNLFPSSII